MKKERKAALLHSFPALPGEYLDQMQGRNLAENFCVFLTHGRELFVRCYHRYCTGALIERQRYVFAKDGAVRYIFDEYEGENGTWRVASKFKEPRFASPYYPYGFNNTYSILNFDAYKHSDMKYSMLNEFRCECPLEYLRLYIRHPNIEYLVKSGYGGLIDVRYDGYYGTLFSLYVDHRVNLKSNNLLKMLGLNRTEFKALKGREKLYRDYISLREHYPKVKPEDLRIIAATYGSEYRMIETHVKLTGLKPQRIARYLLENNVSFIEYRDYLDQCQKLEYDLHDTSISMPHDFHAIHERLSDIIRYKKNDLINRELAQHYDDRKAFECEYGELFLRQPGSIDEIIAEGKALHHCVGGYAERHAKGTTNIFFIRKESDPDTPYYTIEVSNDYRIIQCRGYKNDAGREKPDEIKAFEKEYTKYLEELKHEQQRIRCKSA
jgi:hypothetical protein